MADTRKDYGDGYVGEALPELTREDDAFTRDVALMLQNAVNGLRQAVNGQLTLGIPGSSVLGVNGPSRPSAGVHSGNLDGEWLEHTVDGSSETLVHNLGRVPVFFFVMPIDAGVTVRALNIEAWTAKTFQVKSSAAGRVRFLLV